MQNPSMQNILPVNLLVWTGLNMISILSVKSSAFTSKDPRRDFDYRMTVPYFAGWLVVGVCMCIWETAVAWQHTSYLRTSLTHSYVSGGWRTHRSTCSILLAIEVTKPLGEEKIPKCSRVNHTFNLHQVAIVSVWLITWCYYPIWYRKKMAWRNWDRILECEETSELIQPRSFPTVGEATEVP